MGHRSWASWAKIGLQVEPSVGGALCQALPKHDHQCQTPDSADLEFCSFGVVLVVFCVALMVFLCCFELLMVFFVVLSF